MSLHLRLLLGFVIGLVAGLAAHLFAGADAPWLQALTNYVTQPVGQIFLRLPFMLVIPLIFSALVLGVAEMGDIRSLGRIGGRTLVYTIVVSSIAVVIGLTLVNLFRPGDGIDPAVAQSLISDAADRAPRRSSPAASRPAASRCWCRSCRTTWSAPRRSTTSSR